MKRTQDSESDTPESSLGWSQVSVGRLYVIRRLICKITLVFINVGSLKRQKVQLYIEAKQNRVFILLGMLPYTW